MNPPLPQVPSTPTISYRWLEDAITDWQTSQGVNMHIGGQGVAGRYTPQQVGHWFAVCVRESIIGVGMCLHSLVLLYTPIPSNNLHPLSPSKHC
jgi:hypothetical protein